MRTWVFVTLMPGERGDAVDVDQDLGRGDAEVQHRHEALSAREHARVVLVLVEQGERLGDARRPRVREARCFHRSSSVGIMKHSPASKEDDMEFHETLPRRGISRKEMMKRVARFTKLKGSDGGLPDSKMPGCERILYNVIGFQPPKVEASGKQSPGRRHRRAPRGDQDLRRLQPRLLQGGAGQRADAAQPRHQRDLHRHDRHLARELGEREGQARARRPQAARPDLASRRARRAAS